ncbi:MAG: tyrosine-type recombinase/integrase [Burkholderiales bacterium]|nr:tyrosine-type recombinase/integrase [Burkholderiales bacterium]
MGQKSMSGIYADNNATWQVDRQWKKTRLRQRGFTSYEEAEGWLIKQLAARRAVVLHGERAERTFDEVAAHYLVSHQDKPSLETETFLLKSIMSHIGSLPLHQVHDSTLAPYITERLAKGRSHKTVNLALGVVRRILNLAASSWRDEQGRTWLPQAPTITLLPLVGHQREPRPISWHQQRALLPKLPDHLARMSLFVLNTGVRDNVVCSLRWEWEIKVPQLGISVFEVPAEHVKGRRRSRIVVCNSVAQSVIESVRGQHVDFVFVWRRERKKNLDRAPAMEYRPQLTMNNTAWQNGRKAASLGDLHVHDLRHTVGMRLREAGVTESTISDILWHTSPSMTRHYSVAQIVELHAALELIKADSGRWNLSLASLRLEQEAARGTTSPPKVTQERKTA